MMRFLSLCSGIEAASVAWKPLGFECAGVAEMDAFPSAVLAHRYPTVPNLGDITKITQEKLNELGKIDIIIGGTPCFEGDTSIVLKDSFKAIKEVKVGDTVLTHALTYEKVLRVGSKLSSVYRLKARGIVDTTTTQEHPYYIRSQIRKWNQKKGKNGGYEVFWSEPRWEEVENLKKGDYVGMPIIQEEENPLGLTSEECWILGRYIADGHTRKDYRVSEDRPNHRRWVLILSIGSHKVDEVKNNLKDYTPLIASHTQSTHRATFYSKRLVEIAEKHCGSGSKHKFFSKTLLNLPIDLLKQLLAGYWSGDGSKLKCGGYYCTTISKGIATTLPLAFAKAFRLPSSISFSVRPKTTIIEGRVVNQSDTYTVTCRRRKTREYAPVIDDILWLPIRKVKELEQKEIVYNLEVENENSYTAAGAIVHNCQAFSIGGKREGLKDDRGRVMLAYVEIINKVRPKYLIWENVRGVLSQDGGRAFGTLLRELAELGYTLEWRVCDSQFFGVPQSRGRVILVGYMGNFSGRSLLFDGESRCGDSTPTRPKGFKGLRSLIKSSLITATKILTNGREVVGCLCARDSKGIGSDDPGMGKIVIEVDCQTKDVKLRRLTPIEYEKLQGFQKDWTKVPYNGRSADKCPKGHRYKALGNSMTVQVIKWVGEKIIDFDNSLE